MKFVLPFLLLLPTFVSAQENPQFTSQTKLIEEAIRLTGYDRPTILPQVRYVDIAQMSKKVCHGRALCRVMGAYFDDDIIYIRRDLDPDMHDHILLHEDVHWLQHHSGKFDLNNCNDTVVREREAYNIENIYIGETQQNFQFLIPPSMNCENKAS
jgi:hypothetical protein